MKKLVVASLLVVICFAGCQKANKEQQELPDPNGHITSVGKVVTLEQIGTMSDGVLIYTLETTRGFFTVYGLEMTAKRMSQVEKQGDFIYVEDNEGAYKRYSIQRLE